MDTHLLILGDQVYFEGDKTPSTQSIIEAGGHRDEASGAYYLLPDQTDALVKLAAPFASTRIPVTGKMYPGTFYTFDAMESFVVGVDLDNSEALLINVQRENKISPTENG